MYLIAGLGNVGEMYSGTRHNIGFFLIDSYLAAAAAPFSKNRDLLGSIASFGGGYFLKPGTYMNRSGESVLRALKYFCLTPRALLVLYDDANLSFGQLQLRLKGGAGGHKGLKSIDAALNTQEYARFQIGIGRSSCQPLDEYVLSPFTQEEREWFEEKKRMMHCMIDEWIKGVVG